MPTWEELAQEENAGEYKQTGGFTPMPEGTRVLQTLEEIKFQSFQGSDHKTLNLKWRVDAPEEFKGRVYYQTIYINGSDPTGPYYDESKQDKNIADARRMVLAIDFHAGKHIAALKREPREEEYRHCLIAAQMMAVLGVTGKGKQTVRGISGVDPELKQQQSAKKETPKASITMKKEVKSVFSKDSDPDIPFN